MDAHAAQPTVPSWAIFPCHSPVDGGCSCGNPDCNSKAKHPRTPNGLKDATTDVEKQQHWWRKWPKANLAIATGPSGLVVIDIDVDGDDRKGFETMLSLEEEHGRFPETVSVRTGRGGLHLYYKAPCDRKISSKLGWLPGIDVKATGGYVLAPPSINMNGPYSWEPGCAPGEIEIAEIPAWLLDLLPIKEAEKSSAPPAATNGNGHASLLQRAQQYAAKAEGASEGTRNSAAFNLAGNLAAFSDEYGGRLAECDILSVMAGWNARCNPPLGDSELASCVASSLRNGSPRPPKPQAERSTRAAERSTSPSAPLACIALQQLCGAYPRMRKPVISGIAREGEIVNVVAPPKFGKSWWGYGLLLSHVTARPLFNRFSTIGGNALLVDNELHPNTIAHRIPAVADALSIPAVDYESKLDVASLRGNLRSFGDVASELSDVGRRYSLILFDAKYRFALPGVSENDNAAETQFYNLADELADRTGAVLVFIHHASKGNQAGKSITDVGAGAGAQARAADCHIVLREHEQQGIVVMEAAVRSFAPIEPLALRWQFPVWVAESSVDPSRLKRQPTASQQRQQSADREGMEATIKALRDGPLTARKLRSKTGFGEYRQQRMLDLLTSQGHVVPVENEKGNGQTEYRIAD